MSVRETHYYTGQIKEWIAIAKDLSRSGDSRLTPNQNLLMHDG